MKKMASKLWCRTRTSKDYVLTVFLKKLYGELGCLAYRRPYLVVSVSVFVSLLISTGMIQLTMETNSAELFIPQDLVEYKNLQKTSELFAEKGRSGQVVFVAQKDAPSQDILSESVLLDVYDAYEHLFAQSTFQGADYQKVCVPLVFQGPCSTWNMFELFEQNRTRLQAAIQTGTVKSQLTVLGEKVALGAFLGGIQRDEVTNAVLQAEALIISYFVYDTHEGKGWESKLMEEILASNQPKVRVEILSQSAVNSEITRLVQGDSPMFASAVIVILIYLSFTLSPMDKVKSRFLLAWTGIMTVMLSIAVAFGMTGFMGVKINSIVFLIPFILCGVGVDDIIVIVHYFDEFVYITDGKERMKQTLIQAGTAISLTSFTSVFAFFSGIFIPLPGVASFCLNAMIAFLWAWLMGITLFPACLVLDQRRIERRGHFLFPWMTVSRDPKEEMVLPQKTRANQDAILSDTPDASKVNLATVLKNVSKDLAATDEIQPDASARQVNIDCAGFTTDKETSTAKSWQNVTRLEAHDFKYQDAFTSIVLSLPGKVAVLILTMGFCLLAGVAMLPKIEVGLLIRDVLPDDSFVNRALDILEGKWNQTVSSWDIIVENTDYSDETQLRKTLDFLAWFEKQPFALPPFGKAHSTWLNVYLQYMEQKNVSVNHFYAFLEEAITESPILDRDIVCGDSRCTSISTARFSIFALDPPNTRDRLAILDAVNAKIVAEKLDEKMYLNSDAFIYAASDALIPTLTIETLVSSIFTIFLVLLFFMPPGMSLLITILVAMIDIDLLSILYLWDIKLNAVSFVNLVMSVGLSVDYCVHIGHAYTEAQGSGYERVRHTIRSMGGSVCKGGLTTFAGVLTLAFTSSAAFRTFFKMLFFTVILGLYHALVFMPVVLSLIGDRIIPSHHP